MIIIPVALVITARELDPLHLLPEQDDDEDGNHYDGDIIVILLFTAFLNKMMMKMARELNKMMMKIVMKMIIVW